MNEQLSAYKIKQGRRIYDIYNIVNSFSFALVTGNTITLYALLLKANTTEVGLLTAFMYLSFFAIPIGKLMVSRFSIMQTFGLAWLLRTASLLPILAIPILVSLGLERNALYCLLLAVGFFNFFRGVGMIANNPVIRILAPGKDRSSYIVRISLTNNLAALLATILLAWLLRFDSSVQTYNLTSIVGILLGFIGSLLLFKIPEPESAKPKRHAGTAAEQTNRAAGTETSGTRSAFFNHVRNAFKDANFRRFVLAFFIVSLGIAMIRPFVIVYAKEVYGRQDSAATVLTVYALVGALGVGFLMHLIIDRIGAKPIFIIFTALSALSLIPALFAPGLAGAGMTGTVFLIAFTMVSNIGFVGQDNSSQAYFFSMVPEDALMDLSMLYYCILAVTGGLGSVLGGSILDFLRLQGFSHLESYRLFFLIVIAVILIGIVFQRKLLNLGSYRVFETLAVLLSPRDMKALNLLHKLDRSDNLATEERILNALGEIASSVSCDQLLHYLESPRFAIRMHALAALNSMPSINAKACDVVLQELAHGEFTTAPLAAKILGKFKVQQAVVPLRAALESRDYYLAGEAMVALAELNDDDSQSKIGSILTNAENPALILKGIQALELFNADNSPTLILDILRREHLAPTLENEALLALASLMGIQNDFYYIFEKYRIEKQSPSVLLTEILDEYFETKKVTDLELKKTVIDFLQDGRYDEAFIRWLMSFGKNKLGIRAALLIGIALDADLLYRDSFRFFLAFWAICLFKKPELAER